MRFLSALVCAATAVAGRAGHAATPSATLAGGTRVDPAVGARADWPSITASGARFSWNEAHEVYRNGRLIARFRAHDDDEEVIANLKRIVARESDPADDSFSVCFSPPRLRAPAADVRERVRAYGALVRTEARAAGLENAAWAQAIITHESGGDPGAISPTGCAGLAARCDSPDGAPSCCVLDETDAHRTVYDLCNTETATGYRCDRGRDSRFDPGAAVRYVVERLREIDGKLHRLERRGVPVVPERVVPMAYNAGLGCFPRFPAATGSLRAIMSQLELSAGGYPEWKLRSKANKAIEVFDYLRWFPYLVKVWETDTGGTVAASMRKDAASPPAALLCFHHSPNASRRFVVHEPRSLASVLVPQVLEKLRVRRLSFGRYEDDRAYFARGAWEN